MVNVLVSGAAVSYSSADEYPSLPPRVLSSDVFPCSNCHDGIETNHEKRELDFHAEKKITGHAEKERWCLDCHDASDRDKVRLINGKKVDFNSSHRLCGQCHGTVYQDWKAGIHGRRMGTWDGVKSYLLCTYCHDPHNPRFKPLAPLAAPVRPEETLRR